MKEKTKKIYVVVDYEDPTPIEYHNVYEDDDIWVKIKGCDECPLESRLMCCGNCQMLLKDTGECRLHTINSSPQKPYHCVVYPTPEKCLNWCQLEFECVQGSNKGKIRRIKDIRNVFQEK